ncbi:MAG TPA: hypothetical protein VLT58_13875 [Polyangia bacterium]|nr:hypothetical protein [Polyangia bacterium]
MPAYRPLRPGDLLAVRTNDPHLDEIQDVIDRVVDNGATLLIAGDWRGRDLEVLIRRVGGIHPRNAEN